MNIMNHVPMGIAIIAAMQRVSARIVVMLKSDKNKAMNYFMN